MAYAIGLHCHPKYLEPAPPTQTELATRQKIWWYMLRIDEEYSMTFGRPLGISSIGTCCWPQELTTDPIVRRFGEFMAQFTVLARQILSSDRLINLRIDELTDALRRLLDTIPEILQFNAAWNRPENTSSHELWPLMNMAAGTFTDFFLLICSRCEGILIRNSNEFHVLEKHLLHDNQLSWRFYEGVSRFLISLLTESSFPLQGPHLFYTSEPTEGTKHHFRHHAKLPRCQPFPFQQLVTNDVNEYWCPGPRCRDSLIGGNPLCFRILLS